MLAGPGYFTVHNVVGACKKKKKKKRKKRKKKLVKHRGHLPFSGEYQIYFIECVENISNFTSA